MAAKTPVIQVGMSVCAMGRGKKKTDKTTAVAASVLRFTLSLATYTTEGALTYQNTSLYSIRGCPAEK